MEDTEYLKDLENCRLCEHRCGVNRLRGETGVCRVTMPVVASATLHPAPPESYTVFMGGCNYKCLHCQNWTISQYPDNGYEGVRGYLSPENLAKECIQRLHSYSAKSMGADRIFFSGGEPTIHLPYIEKVVEEARKIQPDTKVNFDTNGYLTEESFTRVVNFTTSVTFDLKACHDEANLALTGAFSKPVLRNAEYIGRYAKDKLWEYRIVVIPKINDHQIRPLTEFIVDIDPFLPVCFLAFRPNFVLENHPGASIHLMKTCVDIARSSGLKNVTWSGHPDILGRIIDENGTVRSNYSQEALLASTYALNAGCQHTLRNCSNCRSNQVCRVKQYIPHRVT